MQRLLTIQETMQILNISSRDTMYHIMKEPGFPAYKIGGRTRIGEDELEVWVKKQRKR